MISRWVWTTGVGSSSAAVSLKTACVPPFPTSSVRLPEVFGKNSVGVLLTGMGKDGAHELKLMKGKGAVTIAQDRESSVVYGMPGEAAAINAAAYILPPARIAEFLSGLPRAKTNGRRSLGEKTGLERIRNREAHMDKIKILIAEDSITQAMQLQHILEENGYEADRCRQWQGGPSVHRRIQAIHRHLRHHHAGDGRL